MNTNSKSLLYLSAICVAIILLYSCASQSNSIANKGLQNLSAKYNYIYNSNILLSTYQEELSLTIKDNYDQLLPIYIAPAPIDFITESLKVKELEDITKKAQAIIAEKNQSNYIDEAYLLLGKTNFYQSEFFNAVAYFDYTAKTFKTSKKTYLKALNWKARSLIQLSDSIAVSKVLDTVKKYIDSVKTNKAEPLATLAQMSIYKKDYKAAITYLKYAIKETNEMQSRTRWPYILAQLYEREKDYKNSLRYFEKVEKSNAPFEMYFNAKLSKIRIKDFLNPILTDRKKELLKLLKDDKNLDFTDQIYYEVAEDYYADLDFSKALSFYQRSAKMSTINQFQKGLSYLKIAELNFKDLRDYFSAKLYYDSAVTTLPKEYPNYETIVNKAGNLAYLAERYQLIATQDTLQSIARLNEKERNKKLDLMFESKKEISLINKSENLIRNNQRNGSQIRDGEGTFYFSNLTAVSNGLADFKKRWGNRFLTDNWRQSVKSSSQLNQQNQTLALNNKKDSLNTAPINLATEKAEKIKNFIAQLPLSADQLKNSDQLIIDAYFETASFYQQALNDQNEAIKIYELLLQRYPQNNHLESIYYSLYLGYKEIDQAKAIRYKNLVLDNYPNSVFAKIIKDPNFSIKQNELEIEINKLYNTTFATYVEKDFLKVINSVAEVKQRFPNNNLQAQYDYLRAIAIGRTQNVDSLLIAFNQLIDEYSDDQLINPLVKNHIAYIIENLNSFQSRKIALLDFDPTEPPFIDKQTDKAIVNKKPSTQPDLSTLNKVKDSLPATLIKPIIETSTQKTATTNQELTKAIEVKANANKEQVSITPNITKPTIGTALKNEPVKPLISNIFNLSESKTYFYVIAVANANINVSSSRFGLGQFNRGKYPSENLKHQLIELDEDQLIYIGEFSTLQEVKNYSVSMNSLLSKIMKVPSTTYESFYISKENFNKIKNKETINKYLEFFKSNY